MKTEHAALSWPTGYLSTTQAAAALQVSSQRIQQLRDGGKLPGVVVGDRWYYCQADVEALVAARAAQDPVAARKAAAARALDTWHANQVQHAFSPSSTRRSGTEGGA